MPLAPEEYLRPDVVRQIQRLDLRARCILDGFLAGLHRSLSHGFSVEFSEHRRYEPGDDLRRIDWQVYAKTDRFYVKEFQAETQLEAYLLVDCSGSMGCTSGERMTKMDYAICLAAAMGLLCLQQGDPVGLFVFDEKLRAHLRPRNRRSHLTEILATLARTVPFGRTNLAGALHQIAERIPKRSLVILLSDLLDDEHAVVNALHHLGHGKHDLILLQVLDHVERTLDVDGQAVFEDPETGSATTADARGVREAYREELEAFLETYRSACRGLRADLVTVDNAMTFDKALLEFLIQRQHRG